MTFYLSKRGDRKRDLAIKSQIRHLSIQAAIRALQSRSHIIAAALHRRSLSAVIDMDMLGKIRRYHKKERRRISKLAKFEGDTS